MVTHWPRATVDGVITRVGAARARSGVTSRIIAAPIKGAMTGSRRVDWMSRAAEIMVTFLSTDGVMSVPDRHLQPREAISRCHEGRLPIRPGRYRERAARARLDRDAVGPLHPRGLSVGIRARQSTLTSGTCR